MFRRIAPGLVALGLIGAIGHTVVSCGSAEEAAFDYSAPGAPCDRGYALCSEDYDCYTGYVYEVGTMCIDGLCQCPTEGDIICNGKNHPFDNNERGCRNPRDCEPGEVCFDGGVPEEEQDSGASLPPPPPECSEGDVSACAGPPDKRCGEATCVEGKCALKITPGPIASQKAGDCKRSVCNLSGVVEQEEDLSDYYDDGEQCTFDMCIEGQAQAITITSVVGPGSIIVCPDSEEGYCSDSECVQCMEHADCKGTEICIQHHCIPDTCANNVKDGAAESDIDCGGDCLPCPSGGSCVGSSDCASSVCKDMQCQAPSCDDGKKNDGETDKDCGSKCKNPPKLCGDGQGCEIGADCQSSVCFAGKCKAATCTDGVQNQAEAGIDCGGNCGECL